MIPERISEDENHGDDKGVNRCGLDHCEAHEQCAGNGRRGVRLLRQGRHGGSNRTAFAKRRSHAAKTCSDAGGGDRYYCNDGGAIHWKSFLLWEPLRMTGLRLGLNCRLGFGYLCGGGNIAVSYT